MKCISLWEPWATLMAIGAKKNETRSWPTSYRGILAIHAAKKWNRQLADLCWTEPFKSKLIMQRPNMAGCADLDYALKNHILSFGCVVATVEVIDCIEINPSNIPTGNELAFGDYGIGRFMWITRNVKRLRCPVSFKGAQGFFDIPDNAILEAGFHG